MGSTRWISTDLRKKFCRNRSISEIKHRYLVIYCEFTFYDLIPKILLPYCRRCSISSFLYLDKWVESSSSYAKVLVTNIEYVCEGKNNSIKKMKEK